MATTTMHFGPEWMRTKHQAPARAQLQPPFPSPVSSGTPSGASTYSALVSPAPPPQVEKRDEAHPFRYSKEEMLRIYSEGGGKGGLGLEVERWEGVVREIGSDPISLREMGEAEKKLFATSLNSELRRRQSTDYLGVERPRLNHTVSSGSAMRGGFSSYMGKRRDSTDQLPSTMPRRLSHSSIHPPLGSPKEASQPSPRGRAGFGPSFDGVLNGGESWIARRKTSEPLGKLGTNTGPREVHGGTEAGVKVLDVHEEETLPPSDTKAENGDEGGYVAELKSYANPVESGFADLHASPRSSEMKVASMVEATSTPLAAGPPPGLPDLTSVEWSYLDPQGNVQGPFQAHLMQKWHDDGYFSHDLLMKRTHVDTQWTPLGDLIHRFGSGKFFLSSAMLLRSSPLPGGTESNFQGLGISSEVQGTKGSFLPTGSRSFRASTLDSYLGTPSTLSDSPTSSFSTGRYSSQDVSAFNTAPASAFAPADSIGGNRISGFSAIPEDQAGFVGNVLSEQLSDPSLTGDSPFGNVSAARPPSVEGYNLVNAYGPHPPAWPTSSNNHNGQGMELRPDSTNRYSFSAPGPNSAPPAGNISQGLVYSNVHPQDRPSDSGGASFTAYAEVDYGGNESGHREPQFQTRSVMDERDFGVDFNGSYATAVVPNAPLGLPTPNQRFTPSPSIPYTASHRDQSTSFEQPLSPWNTQYETPSRRSGPFDPSHPPPNSTTLPVTPSYSSPWGRTRTPQPPSQPSPQPPDAPSSWVHVSQNKVDDSWIEAPGPNSLTFSNVGQHNQQQEQDEHRVPPAPVIPQQPSEPPRVAESATIPANEVKVAQTSAASKVRRRATAPQLTLLPTTTHAPSQPSLSAVDPPAPSVAKQAWSNDESKKVKLPSPMSLREIQEVEEKRLEIRKAAEKERERVARVPNSSSASDEVQPFTASWGLPTSQAGALRNVPLKEPQALSSGTSSSPPAVWTTAAKPQIAKKTMKEIQEEEEKRKRLPVKETASVVIKRAVAEPANKPLAALSTGNAWTTVGAGGKTAPASTTSVRPLPASTVAHAGAASSSAAKANSPTPLRAPPASVKPAQAPTKVDESPAQPSHEFLRWLADTLKGLNNTVNIEEITSMLLSFPIDPDASTMEIISDLIYANSTTLDGRRFTSDFVSRRKTDAFSRPKGTGVGAVGKPISIADVVKAQPKSTQPEWSGFKVVNKKKKGGRS